MEEEEEEELKQKNVSFLHFRNGTLTRLCVCVSVSPGFFLLLSLLFFISPPPTHTEIPIVKKKREEFKCQHVPARGESNDAPSAVKSIRGNQGESRALLRSSSRKQTKPLEIKRISHTTFFPVQRRRRGGSSFRKSISVIFISSLNI
jgi:hypothetical protein